MPPLVLNSLPLSTCMVAPNPLVLFFPMALWLLTGPLYIGWLKQKQFGQFIREDGPQSHQQKAGTPTMGGLLILLSVFLTLAGVMVVTPRLMEPTWINPLLGCLLVLVVFGALGFSDDWLKITKHHNKGITGWTKLAVQVLTGLIIGLWVMKTQPLGSVVSLGSWQMDLGWAYPLLAAFMVTAASNAYNITDGLDGLAASTGIATFVGFAFILSLNPALTIVSMVLAGGCLGFLVFNRHPAKIFMGDTGSLALGGAMASLALFGKIEVLLLPLAGLYVIETLSVILQVGYFKLTKGKRLFKMSPLHHHFELCGWSEVAIVLCFALVQTAFSLTAVLLYNKGVFHPPV